MKAKSSYNIPTSQSNKGRAMGLLIEFKKQLKQLTSSTYLKVALIAIIIVPLLYGALYLKAFWNPYGQLSDMPVAVVNLDKGYDDKGT